MAEPHGDGTEPSKEQRRFLEEFYQEEHVDPDDPLSSSKRDRVSRKHIHAAANKWLPADTAARQAAIARTLYQTFSGYVHGAYVHIMELFWGSQFRTRGMLGTLRIQECLDNHPNYVFRSLLAVELVARRAYRDDVKNHALDLLIVLARQTGCLNAEGIASAERRRAQGLVAPS